MEAFKGATMLIGGGMTTAVTVELLSQLDPEACGVWLTAFQVLGIAMSASKSQLSKSNNPTSTKETKSTKSTKETKQSTKSQTLFIPRLFTKRKIPILTHCTSASLVAVAMIASNSAIAYQIPLPLHILLKSASLPASAFISYYTGRLTLNKPTIGAISTVTAGVLIATIGGAPPSSSTRSSLSKRNSTLIGGLLAAGSVVASAILGAFQDNTFETYGKHWREALFYSHALTLPSFFLFRKQLYQILKRWLQPKKRNIKLWLLLLSNIACVNVAMSGIYKITNETSSLSCTIAVTVRKFLSLLLSLQLFNKGIFGKSQWIGTMGVFGGSLFWTLLRAFSSPTTRSKKKKHINNQITKQIDPRIQESLNPIYLPSPSQQLHLIFNYPESNTKNDFRSIVVDILKTADVKHTLNSYGNDHETLLSKLHLQKGARLGRKNQKHSPFHKAFKTIVHRKGNTETHQLLNVRFNTIMKHFVRTVVAPLLEVKSIVKRKRACIAYMEKHCSFSNFYSSSLIQTCFIVFVTYLL